MNIIQNKKILYGIGIIILLTVIFITIALKSGSKKEVRDLNPISPKIDVLSNTTLPSAIPSDIPLENGSTILRNEIVRLGNGEVQYVRKFFSKKTVSENFSLYKKYLEKTLKWPIKSETETSSFASLLSEKEGGGGVLQIMISENSISKAVSVELNMVIK